MDAQLAKYIKKEQVCSPLSEERELLATDLVARSTKFNASPKLMEVEDRHSKMGMLLKHTVTITDLNEY